MNKTKYDLIVFEGPSNVGKTTLSKMVTEKLNQQGIKAKRNAFPGIRKHSLGSHIMQMYINFKQFKINSIHPLSMHLLNMAAHIDIIEEEIKPLMTDGNRIVLDRYWWSSYVNGRIGGIQEDILKHMISIYKGVGGGASKIIFNIQRDDSSLKGKELEERVLFTKEYSHIADMEKNNSTVVNIDNSKNLEYSFDKIVSHIF